MSNFTEFKDTLQAPSQFERLLELLVDMGVEFRHTRNYGPGAEVFGEELVINWHRGRPPTRLVFNAAGAYQGGSRVSLEPTLLTNRFCFGA